LARRVTLSEPYSQLNITSLVDIALTLLTLFIIITPFLQQSLDLQLPVAGGKPMKSEETVMVSLTSGGRLLVNGQPIPRDSLPGLLQSLTATSPNRPVYLSADRSVPYGQVVEIMDRIKGAGITALGIVTQPQ
jgi:biopolymer transport protein ExbD